MVSLYKRHTPNSKGWSRDDQTADPSVLEKLEAKEEELAQAKL